MKRDMDLIRTLLLRLEELPIQVGEAYFLSIGTYETPYASPLKQQAIAA